VYSVLSKQHRPYGCAVPRSRTATRERRPRDAAIKRARTPRRPHAQHARRHQPQRLLVGGTGGIGGIDTAPADRQADTHSYCRSQQALDAQCHQLSSRRDGTAVGGAVGGSAGAGAAGLPRAACGRSRWRHAVQRWRGEAVWRLRLRQRSRRGLLRGGLPQASPPHTGGETGLLSVSLGRHRNEAAGITDFTATDGVRIDFTAPMGRSGTGIDGGPIGFTQPRVFLCRIQPTGTSRVNLGNGTKPNQIKRPKKWLGS
jgi:hypothetical protein